MHRRNRIGLWLMALLSVIALPSLGHSPHHPVVLGRGRLNSAAKAASLQADRHLIRYEVMPQIQQEPRLLRVQAQFSVSGPSYHVSLAMAVWSPGDYHQMNHGKYVTDLTAWDGAPEQGHKLMVSHRDFSTWEVAPGQTRQVTVTYTLPQTPPGYFSENVQLLDHQVFLNGPATFLYRVDHKEDPAELHLSLPAGWQSETSLEPTGNVPDTYAAPDYDTLADSPVVMAAPGAMQTRAFTLGDTSFRAVYFGHVESLKDPDVYTDVLRRIATAESDIMGGMPTKRYRFLFDVNGRGGGLEHLNCCRIALPAGVPPRFVAAFVSHEFFHLWNVKRIRPRVLGPFDYQHPPTTRNLWFAEGVTEYYAHIATRRAGIATKDQFVKHWSQAFGSFERVPERRQVSADESSQRVWEAGNSQGFGISYYQKGELIGLCLDLKIRNVTNNRRSLDDVMRLLMKRHNPPKPGYGEDEIRATVNEVAGVDLSAFYDALARSTEEMPVAECLGYAGYDVEGNPLPGITPAQLALQENWTALTGEKRPQ